MWRDFLTVCLFGILEGITEWLPVSSTGHLILLQDVLALPMRGAVQELFDMVIQLGAILAVAVLYFKRLNPLARTKAPAERRATLALWGKLLLALLPAAVVGFFLDDFLTEHLFCPEVVALTLILYGVLFLLVERRKKTEIPGDVVEIPAKTALAVGCFQALSLVPGTSRSGSTILGGMCMGLSRPAAAEFSFFLGIPTMLGAGLFKSVRFFAAGELLTAREAALLAAGTLTAFLVSLVTIRFLLDFVRRHSFAPFGIYRILLGVAVLARAFFM